MGISNIKNKNYYKRLAEKYRDRCHYEMERVGFFVNQIETLHEEISKLKSSNEEWQGKYHDLLMKHTELGERMLRMIDEKGAANVQ